MDRLREREREGHHEGGRGNESKVSSKDQLGGEKWGGAMSLRAGCPQDGGSDDIKSNLGEKNLHI